jgi:hypothetical protein
MADDFLIDLHPLHQQALANLALLKLAQRSPETDKAIDRLNKIVHMLEDMDCRAMGFRVRFAPPTKGT